MRKRISMLVSCLCLALLSLNGFSKTPTVLKSEFKDILPAGKKARCAWLKGGFHRDDLYAGSHDRSIYVVDSDDGIIRELTPDSIFPAKKRNIDNPLITFDGSRVIFNEGYSGTKYIINWDGTGLKSFTAEGYLSRYWHDPVANTDWAIVHQYNISRYNIDNPAQQVNVWGLTDLTNPWFTLSQDGTHMGFSPGGQNVGIAQVPNGKLVLADTLGCRVNIAPDNSYDILFQLPYHRIARMCDSNGIVKKDYIITDTIIKWATQTGHLNACRPYMEYETLRWSNHRDYITFYTYFTNVNPFIWRLSDGKWMYVDDSLGQCGFAGNMDLCVLDTGKVANSVPSIFSVNDFETVVNNPALVRNLGVAGLPLSKLSVKGLPKGMVVADSATPKSAFKLSGTPQDTGMFTVVITATNSLGVDSDTFSIKVKSTNSAPVVSAGADTLTRIGRKFNLNGNASDDGFPNLLPSISWRRISGIGTATIAVAASATTQVTFADSSIGIQKFEITANDGELQSKDTVVITVLPFIALKVITPALGDTVQAGTTVLVRWQIDMPTTTTVLLSTDNGKTTIDLTEGKTIPATDSTFLWDISTLLPNSSNCIISIVDYLTRKTIVTSGKFILRGGSKIISPLVKKQNMVYLHKEYEFYTINGKRINSSVAIRGGFMGNPTAGILVRRLKNPQAHSGSRFVVVP